MWCVLDCSLVNGTEESMTKTFYIFVLVILGSEIGCGTMENNPRRLYNEALSNIRTQKYDTAKEQLMKARQSTAGDRPLQIAAAWQLAELHATQGATQYAEQNLDAAIGSYRSSRSWFQDAIDLTPPKPDNEKLRANWELVGRKIQIISDEMNKDGGLQKKIEQAMEEQRGIRDQVRSFMATSPTIDAFSQSIREQFHQLAKTQRIALASVGTIVDLAQSELDGINNLSEEEKTAEKANRAIQLQNLMQYLYQARQFQSASRKQLRSVEATELARGTHHAVENLKRAREQLLSPPQVLRDLLGDQLRLNVQTKQLGESAKLDAQQSSPAWLTHSEIADRQDLVAQRVGELLLRLNGAVEHNASKNSDAEPSSPEMMMALDIAKNAIPFLERAKSEQNAAISKLTRQQLPLKNQEVATLEMANALELFSDLRQTIELTYQDHNRSLAILKNEHPDVKKLSPSEKSKFVREALTKNSARLVRMRTLIESENKPAQQNGQQPAGEETEEQVQQREQLYARAEELRTSAANHLAEYARTKKLAAAEAGMNDITELRKLFFTLIEHLKQLLADQVKTRDETSAVQDVTAPDDERKVLAPLAPLQSQHQLMAEKITKALEEYASNQNQQGQQPNPQNDPKRFSDAAIEVNEANSAMLGVIQSFADGIDENRTTSIDKDNLLKQQQTAIGHLEEALRILEPPKNDPQDDQQNDQQDDPQQNQEKSKEGMSEAEAKRREQAIRDEQEQRQKTKKNADTDRTPIKDW